MATRGTVGSLLVSMRAELGQLKTDVKSIESTFNDGFKNISKSAQGLNTSINSGFAGIAAGARALGGALVGALSVTAIIGFGSRIVALGGQLTDLSERTGISARALSGIKSTLEENGASLETFAKAIFIAQKNLGEIKTVTDPAAIAIKDLGLSLDQLRNGNPEQFVEKITDALAKQENPFKRAAIGAALLGKQYQELAPAINALAGRFAELKRQGISEENIKALDDFGDTLTRLGNTMQILASGPVAALTKAITNMAVAFRLLNTDARDFERLESPVKNLSEKLATAANIPLGQIAQSTKEQIEKIGRDSTSAAVRGAAAGLLEARKQLQAFLNTKSAGTSEAPPVKPVQAPFVADNSANVKKADDQTRSFIDSLKKQADALRVNITELGGGGIAAKALGLDLEFAAFKAKLLAEGLGVPAKATADFQKFRAEIIQLNEEFAKTKIFLESLAIDEKDIADKSKDLAQTKLAPFTISDDLKNAKLEADFLSAVLGPAYDATAAKLAAVQQAIDRLSKLPFLTENAKQLLIEVEAELKTTQFDRDAADLSRLKLSLDVQAKLGFDVDTLGGQIDLLKRQLEDLFKDFKTPEVALADPRVQELSGQIKAKTEAKTFDDLNKELKLAAQQARVFGIAFDGTGAAIGATKNAIVDLLRSGLDPLDPKITELKIKLDDLSKNQELIEGFRNIANSITSAFDETLRGVLQGTQKFGEAMKNLFRNIMLSITNEILKLGVINPLKKALEEMLNSLVVPGSKGGSSSSGAGFGGILGGLLGGGGGSSFGFGSAPAGVQGPAMANGGFFSTALGGLMSFFGFEKGGPVPASGELKRFAKGGLVEVPRDLQRFAQGGLVPVDGAIQHFAKGGLVRFKPSGTVYADSEVRRFAKGGLVEDGGIIKRFANGGFVSPVRDLQRFAKGGLVEAARPGVVYSPESGRILSTIQRFAKGGLVEVDKEIKRATRFATGGKVKGDADEVPAILHKGEFVLKKSIVEKLGVQFLQRINAGKEVAREITSGGFGKMPAMKMDMPRFIAGGLVGAASMAFAPGSTMAMPSMSAGSVTNNYIDARGAQRGVTAEVQRAIEQGNAKTVKQSVAAMKDDRRRSNNTSKIFK